MSGELKIELARTGRGRLSKKQSELMVCALLIGYVTDTDYRANTFISLFKLGYLHYRDTSIDGKQVTYQLSRLGRAVIELHNEKNKKRPRRRIKSA